MDNELLALINCLKNMQMTDVSRDFVINNLKQMEVSPSLFSAVWHPVGFIHVNFAEYEKSTLRLHLWVPIPERYKGLGWQIHDHTWKLTSYIIYGSVTNFIHNVRPTSNNPTHKLYEVKYDGRINYLASTDELVSYETTKTEALNQGTIYNIEPKIFHSSETPKDSIAATLVLAEKTTINNPRVVGDINGRKTYKMERYSCSDNELSTALSRVLKNL